MERLRKVRYTKPKVEPYIAYFHGFFQYQDGYVAGPIALIESMDGEMHDVEPSYLTFLDLFDEKRGGSMNWNAIAILVHRIECNQYDEAIDTCDDCGKMFVRGDTICCISGVVRREHLCAKCGEKREGKP